MTRKFFIFIFLLLSVDALPQDPTDIISQSREKMKVDAFEAISTLTITDSRGNERIRKNTMASKTFADGTEKRIIKFLSPEEVKGTGILIYDYEDKADDMWIYLPALRKTRRIVSSERSNAFMGSEFTNGDMSAPTLEDFKYTLSGSDLIEGKTCWKIEARPVSRELEDEYGYNYRIVWIEKESLIQRKTEYMDFEGLLQKTITNHTLKLIDIEKKRYMVTDMSAENHQNGRSSSMVMDDIQQTDPDPKYFTVAYLEK